MSAHDRLAKRYAQALDRLENVPADDDGILNDIGMADLSSLYARLHLDDVVQEARSNGRTWDQIAMVLGTTKQAARERFGQGVVSDEVPDEKPGETRAE